MSDSVTGVPAPEYGEGPIQAAPATSSWKKLILWYTGIAIPAGIAVQYIGALGLLAALIAAFTAIVLVIIAIPYTAFVTYKIRRIREEARDALAHGHPDINWAARNFETTSQRLSLINGVALGVVAAVGGIGMLVGSGPAPYIALGILAVLSAAEIYINTGWIYNRETAVAEELALRSNTGAPALIRWNRRLGWFIWYTGCAAAIFCIWNVVATF